MPSQREPLAAVGFVAVVWLLFRLLGDGTPFAEGLLKIALWVVPALLVVGATGGAGWRGAVRALGLRGSITGGLLFGVAATLPIAVLAGFRITRNVDFVYGASFQVARLIRGSDAVLGNVVLGPFAEEVLFRGFLIFALARVARWPAGLVIATSGALFGLAHLGNGGAFLQIPGIALSGAIFAWIAMRRGSIWPAVGLHALLNLWWDFFPAQAQLGTVPSMLVAVVLVMAFHAFSRRPAAERFARVDASQSAVSD